MKHPLEFLPQPLRKPFFILFLGLTVVIFGIFAVLEKPMQPNGIVPFEVAGSVERSQAILDSWDENARLIAAFGLGFDYLFMPVYALALSLGLLLAGHEKPSRFHAVTVWLGWGALFAALFDAVENYALMKILVEGSAVVPLPQIAAVCATIKFVLFILSAALGLIGLAVPKNK